MVLDTIKNGKFIFKNTHSDNKKFEIEVNHNDAPDEFFFVHIELDMDRLDQIRERYPRSSTLWRHDREDLRGLYDHDYIHRGR